MTKNYCDICGTDVIGSSMENLFGSRKYTMTIERCCDHGTDVLDMTLCRDCKEKMYYFMRNQTVLTDRVSALEFGNRIRLLFLKPLKNYYQR